MSTLFLVRHGRTPLNAQGRFRGRLDTPLDQVGVEQAEAAAHQLDQADIEAVFASPLRRTMDTARIVAEARGLGVVRVPGLTDLDYGDWQGLTWDEASRTHPKMIAAFRSDPTSVTPPGGEPVAALARRVEAALGGLIGQEPDGALVAVTHDLPIRLTLAAILGLSGPELWLLDVTPGCVIPLAVTATGFEVRNPPRLLDPSETAR